MIKLRWKRPRNGVNEYWLFPGCCTGPEASIAIGIIPHFSEAMRVMCDLSYSHPQPLIIVDGPSVCYLSVFFYTASKCLRAISLTSPES